MASIWPAPAKLNLFLHITGQRDDGYHLLQTIFQFIDFKDEISIDVRRDGIIRRTTQLPGVSEANDLVIRAAKLLQTDAGTGFGADIGVNKILPLGGGLGGGSSNAATTLVALNLLWELNFSTDQLCNLGLQLGADVPVFVRGEAVWAEGVGEKFTPVTLNEPWYLLLIPACHVTTAELFHDPQLTRDCHPITIRNFLSGQVKNVFEPLVRERYPEVDTAMRWVSEFAPARMTGTGACVFAEFATQQAAQKALAECPQDIQARVVRAQNRSPLLDALASSS